VVEQISSAGEREGDASDMRASAEMARWIRLLEEVKADLKGMAENLTTIGRYLDRLEQDMKEILAGLDQILEVYGLSTPTSRQRQSRGRGSC
jgi:hypothetical protein